ncbi:MAG: extracellular solute-binding protein [Ignavibacteriales bacterium]|nr:extracellular solute-binding protein [Ignavibacteriales bacterium]
MNTSVKILFLLLSLVAALAMFALYSGDFGGSSISYLTDRAQKVYFADHISPAHRVVIEQFNKKYAGRIEVVAVDLPFNKFSTNERKELLARSLRSKSDRLDVFSVDYIWTPRFAKWCVDLTPYFTEEEQQRIISPAMQSCIRGGRLVAMPIYIDIGMMYYRTDIVGRVPQADEFQKKLRQSITWRELLSTGTMLGYSRRPYYTFQANDYEGLICNYFEIIKSLDSNAFEHNTIDLRSPVAKKALQFLVDLVHLQQLSPKQVVEFDENKSYEHMLEHDGVFVRGWPNFLENFRKVYGDTSKFRYIGRAALPHFEGQKATSVYGGWNLMVSKFSTKKDAAIEFVRYLQTEEAQKTMFEMGGYIPVNQSVYQDASYRSHHPDLTYYRTLVDNGFHRPFLEDYTRISDIIAHFVHRAIKKEISVDEALEQATVMIESKALLIK